MLSWHSWWKAIRQWLSSHGPALPRITTWKKTKLFKWVLVGTRRLLGGNEVDRYIAHKGEERIKTRENQESRNAVNRNTEEDLNSKKREREREK